MDETLLLELMIYENILSKKMSKEFEMSMFREIKFFFGLHIQQKKDGIYITQSNISR